MLLSKRQDQLNFFHLVEVEETGLATLIFIQVRRNVMKLAKDLIQLRLLVGGFRKE